MNKNEAKTLVMQTMNLTEEEFNEREEWAKENCICDQCPSYTDEEVELAFCWPSVGKAELISDEQNCVCGQCAVFNEAEMKMAYYCTRDSEVAQLTELTEESAA